MKLSEIEFETRSTEIELNKIKGPEARAEEEKKVKTT
jgi:hypothetical protein